MHRGEDEGRRRWGSGLLKLVLPLAMSAGTLAVARAIHSGLSARVVEMAPPDMLARAARQRIGMSTTEARRVFGPASFSYGAAHSVRWEYVFRQEGGAGLEVVHLEFDRDGMLADVGKDVVGGRGTVGRGDSLREDGIERSDSAAVGKRRTD